MKNKLIEVFKRLYKKHPQIIWALGFIGVWIISIPTLRYLDPTTGIFDPGVFQIPIFTIILFVIFMLVAWITMKAIFGELFRFAKNSLKETFNNLTSWQKIVTFYSVYFALFFALVLLARVLVVTPIR